MSQGQIIKRTVTRDLHNRDRIVAHLELRIAAEGERFVGGLSPGFSATGEIFEARKNAGGAARQRMGRESDICGAITDQIAKAFPHLKPFTDLHFSDPDGVPMHAVANGWYWYAGSRPEVTTVQYTGYTGDIYPHQLEKYNLPDTEQGRREYCYRVACNILRVDEIPLSEITPEDESPREFATYLRQRFHEFVDAQRERWAQEAAEARALLESLPED